MRNLNFIKIFKIAFGSMMAIIIAQFIGLAYSTAAGIITLLSIQNTKKETIFVAMRRVASFVAAFIIAGVTFTLGGYRPLTFGIFLLIFVAVSYKFKLEDGISMNAVLMTHILVEQSIGVNWIINETLLLFIGSSIGVILNLYMPRMEEDVIAFQRNVEETTKRIIENIASGINGEALNDKENNFKYLFDVLKVAKKKAYENMNNTLIGDTQYYIDYIAMRKTQTRILKKIYENIKLLSSIPKQSKPVSKFISKISLTYAEHNDAQDLIEELNVLKKYMKDEPLPATREEFENRAILFIVLSDLERFLELKAEFVK